MSIPVCRLGDICSGHPPCWEPRPCDTASEDTFANGLGMHRLLDHWVVHGTFFCPPHDGYLEAGSSTVFTNSLPQGRIGDPINTICASVVATGSPDVLAG